jgi:hypothetical protein
MLLQNAAPAPKSLTKKIKSEPVNDRLIGAGPKGQSAPARKSCPVLAPRAAAAVRRGLCMVISGRDHRPKAELAENPEASTQRRWLLDSVLRLRFPAAPRKDKLEVQRV